MDSSGSEPLQLNDEKPRSQERGFFVYFRVVMHCTSEPSSRHTALFVLQGHLRQTLQRFRVFSVRHFVIAMSLVLCNKVSCQTCVMMRVATDLSPDSCDIFLFRNGLFVLRSTPRSSHPISSYGHYGLFGGEILLNDRFSEGCKHSMVEYRRRSHGLQSEKVLVRFFDEVGRLIFNEQLDLLDSLHRQLLATSDAYFVPRYLTATVLVDSTRLFDSLAIRLPQGDIDSVHVMLNLSRNDLTRRLFVRVRSAKLEDGMMKLARVGFQTIPVLRPSAKSWRKLRDMNGAARIRVNHSLLTYLVEVCRVSSYSKGRLW